MTTFDIGARVRVKSTVPAILRMFCEGAEGTVVRAWMAGHYEVLFGDTRSVIAADCLELVPCETARGKFALGDTVWHYHSIGWTVEAVHYGAGSGYTYDLRSGFFAKCNVPEKELRAAPEQSHAEAAKPQALVDRVASAIYGNLRTGVFPAGADFVAYANLDARRKLLYQNAARAAIKATLRGAADELA